MDRKGKSSDREVGMEMTGQGGCLKGYSVYFLFGINSNVERVPHFIQFGVKYILKPESNGGS